MAGLTQNNRNMQGIPISSEMDPTGVFETLTQWMVQLGGTNNNVPTH